MSKGFHCLYSLGDASNGEIFGESAEDQHPQQLPSLKNMLDG